MRRPLLVLVTVVLALSATIGSAAAGPAPRGSAPATAYAQNNGACLDSEEQAFLGLINGYRAQHGLGALQASHKLDGAADFHSTQMADHNYFSHGLLNGVTWSQNISNFGYTANTWRGENIAAGNSSASGSFSQWKNSPAHNANMLSNTYTVIGIGRAFNSSATYDWYWTTVFGGHVYGGDGGVNCSAPAPSPTPPTVSSGSPYRIFGSARTSNSYPSTNAYDNSTKTAWTTYNAATPPRSAYVYFDLGGTKALGSVQWKWNKSGYADEVRIQVSTDRRSWTTLKWTGNAPADVWQTLKAQGTSARYVRFYFTNPNRDTRLGGLAEVRILA